MIIRSPVKKDSKVVRKLTKISFTVDSYDYEQLKGMKTRAMRAVEENSMDKGADILFGTREDRKEYFAIIQGQDEEQEDKIALFIENFFLLNEVFNKTVVRSKVSKILSEGISIQQVKLENEDPDNQYISGEVAPQPKFDAVVYKEATKNSLLAKKRRLKEIFVSDSAPSEQEANINPPQKKLKPQFPFNIDRGRGTSSMSHDRLVEKYQERIAQVKSEHRAEVAQLRNQYKQLIKEHQEQNKENQVKTNQLRAQITELTNQHQAEITVLTNQHQAQITELTNQHQLKIDEMIEEQYKKIDKLTEEYREDLRNMKE